MPPPDDQLNGFGALLRRARTSRGLSQVELAARAGTTPRHVSFLETGRSRPRTAIVLRLGDTLILPPREQNTMLRAAGLPPVFPERTLHEAEMAPYRNVMESLLDGHEPLPAAVIDRYGAIRDANGAFERLVPGLVGVEPEALVERFFGPGPWRDRLINVEEVLAAWVGRQRLESLRTADPRVTALIQKAEGLVGTATDPGTGSDMPAVCTRIRLDDGETLELFTVVVRFDTARDVTLSELRVELIYPANDTARRFFRPDQP